MKKKKLITILILFLYIMGVVFYQTGKQYDALGKAEILPVNNQRITLLHEKSGDTTWLLLPRQNEKLSVLKVSGNNLTDGFTGEVWVSFTTDLPSKFKKPIDLHRWKQRLAHILANPAVTDTNMRWIETRDKIEKFVSAESADILLYKKAENYNEILFNSFLNRVLSLQNRRQATYFMDRMLFTEDLDTIIINSSQKLITTLAPTKKAGFSIWPFLAISCWLLAGAVGLSGWWKSNAVPEIKEVAAPEPVQLKDDEMIKEIPLEPTYKKEWDMVNKYARQFYERYGQLFEELQATNIPSTEKQREAVLRQFVEMALHAHSFAFYGIMDKLAKLEDSPNARLLFDNINVNELSEDQYKRFTTDAYQTDSKYRLLFEMLKTININELNVLLEDRILIS